MTAPVVHQQAGGAIILSGNLPDGRLFRLCGGGDARQGAYLLKEFGKIMRWYEAQVPPRGRPTVKTIANPQLMPLTRKSR